jgi:DNA-binding response OmpR family regulator
MLEELKEQYRQSLPDKISAIKVLLQDIRAGKADAGERLRHIAHTLHGSGSTFGYPEISLAAREVEHATAEELLKQLAGLIRVLVLAAYTDKPATRPAILIIDDDVDISRLLVALLGQKCPEHQVVIAANGAEALLLLNTGSYALIVLDLLLPDTDGRRILQQIHESRHRGTSIFVLSGVDKPSIREECLALGAKQFIPKPFNPERIAEVIALEIKAPAPMDEAEPKVVARPAQPQPANKQDLLPILVAEDDDLLVGVIRHRLLREGLRVEYVSNGVAALEALDKHQFSLLILDVKMPAMDGFEVLTRLRATRSKTEFPVIMLTALGNEKDVVRGYDLGANDYILKPFSPVELLAKVKNQLKLG